MEEKEEVTVEDKKQSSKPEKAMHIEEVFGEEQMEQVEEVEEKLEQMEETEEVAEMGRGDLNCLSLAIGRCGKAHQRDASTYTHTSHCTKGHDNFRAIVNMR